MKISPIILLASTTALFAEPLSPLPISDVSVDGGFWGPRIETNATVTLPHNLEFIEKTGRMAAFDRAAGEPTDASDNPVSVVDSDIHKILEGAAYALEQRPGMVDLEEVSDKVARVIAAQEEDGFLCPRITLKGEEWRWKDLRHSHVLYSAGHLFEAGVAWKQATGRDDLLESSTRFADLIDEEFGPNKRQVAPGHQEIEMALIRLYEQTGEKRYLDLCRFFLDQRGTWHTGLEGQSGPKPRKDDYNQDRVPLAEAEEAVGHAVRAGYTYSAMTDIAMHCENHDYGPALDRLWEDVVSQKLYLTGSSATAQYYDEGYGDPYVLPNETAYGETCGTIAFAMWAHRMALLHADAQYVDGLERALYNGVLSGISLEGDAFFYKNPLASRGTFKRYSSWNPACCQSNLVRFIPQVGSMAWATRDNEVFVNLFMNSEAKLPLESGEVRLRQETNYPIDGSVRIIVEEPGNAPFTLALRIPGWAREQPVPSELYHFASPSETSPELAIDGESRPAVPDDDGYVHLTRKWKRGEVIELNLPLPVRRILADDRVEANRGRVALQRGPLLYCVESIDHDGLATDALVLPDEAELHTGISPEWLEGVPVIKATAQVAYEPEWGAAIKTKPLKLTAVPYYAWANRNQGFMDVWIARTPDVATALPATTDATKAMVSASSEGGLKMINDGRSGPSSDFRPTPRFAWPDSEEKNGWLQYEWPEPRTLSRSSVYWAVDRRAQVYWGKRIRGVDLAMPQEWKLLYRDGENWKPVEVLGAEGTVWDPNIEPTPYTLRLNLENTVHFKPIKTTALRLEVHFGAAPCAVQEWKVD